MRNVKQTKKGYEFGLGFQNKKNWGKLLTPIFSCFEKIGRVLRIFVTFEDQIGLTSPNKKCKTLQGLEV